MAITIEPIAPTRPLSAPDRPTWASLGRRARWFRVAHAAWAVVALGALGTIWASALARRRDRWLGASLTFLSVQGVGLLVGRGNCPAGPLQRSLGDPVPLFELLLPPRAAKAAIPALAIVTLLGMALVALRPPRRAAAKAGPAVGWPPGPRSPGRAALRDRSDRSRSESRREGAQRQPMGSGGSMPQ
jgi:hypothetical protein